jgi:siroheme synthase-like protein
MTPVENTEELKVSSLNGANNNLFPVFLKLEHLRLLIVGAGNIGLEKLNTVLQNSPATKITIVAIEIKEEIKKIASENANINLLERAFVTADLDYSDLVIVAIGDVTASAAICEEAKKKGKLVNAADKPGLCDFYLGSVVKKGSLKIAISTNGKSPTIAKRLKQVIQNVIPDDFELLLNSMETIRNSLQADFQEKVKRLNEVTKILVEDIQLGKSDKD